MRRRITGAGVALLATLLLVLGLAPATEAATGPTFTVMNTSETLPDGVYFRSATNMASAIRITGFGVYKNERVQASCYAMGEAVAPYGNKVWYYAYNVSRPSVAGRSNEGWINTHFVNDGMTANHAAPGVPVCGASAPHVTPCVVNMRWNKLNLAVNYKGNHRYYGNAWQAATNWSNLGIGFHLTSEKSNTQRDITFQDVYVADPSSPYASAQLNQVPGVNQYGTTTITSNPVRPSNVLIYVNQYQMDKLDDAHRTYALTHELGHALGLAHTEDCGITNPSIMARGGTDVPKRTTITIQYYDRIELEELYGLPTG